MTSDQLLSTQFNYHYELIHISEVLLTKNLQGYIKESNLETFTEISRLKYQLYLVSKALKHQERYV